MDEKKMCILWQESYKCKKGDKIKNPKTQRYNSTKTKAFEKILKMCTKYNIDIISSEEESKCSNHSNCDDTSQTHRNDKPIAVSQESQIFSKSFSSITPNKNTEICVKDAIYSFMNQSQRTNNDFENIKREFLLTKLHLRHSQADLDLSNQEKKELEILENEWNNIINNTFGIDIFNNDFDIIQRSNRRNYYYDLRIRYSKNNKNYGKRIDLKVGENMNEPPQFTEKYVSNIKLFSSYIQYFYENYFTDLYIKYKELFDKDIKKPTIQEYTKSVSSQQCGNKKEDFFKKMKNKSKNEKIFKEFINKISRDSITTFLTQIDLSKSDFTWLIKLLSDKKHVHYFMWSRKNKKFYHTTYTKYINDIIYSIKHGNIHLLTTGAYPKIIVNGSYNKYIEIILRWSNGNGICNPSVKVSWKTRKLSI